MISRTASLAIGRRARHLSWETLLLLLVIPFGARAETASFNIDAQPMPAALSEFAEQSHLQLLYQYNLVDKIFGNAIHGVFDKREALNQLLQNTGLEATYSGLNAVTIRPSQGKTNSAGEQQNAAARARDAAALRAKMASAGCSDNDGPDVRCGSAGHTTFGMESQLEEITVTARRREESVYRTPVAITVLTGDELQSVGVNSLAQLQYLVPGLMVSHNKQGVTLSLRGVTTTDTTTKGEPGINFSTDGVPVNRSEEQALRFFDVQRMEVLSGPQGTLYGKSSTGGAINVISNAPKQVEEASATVRVGNYDTKRLDAMINVPLNNILAVRAAVSANYRDGFVILAGDDSNNRPYDENNVTARVSALARFSDDLRLHVSITAGQVGGVGFGNNGGALDIGNDYKGEGTMVGYANRFNGHVRDHFAKSRVQLDAPAGAMNMMYLGSYSSYRTDNLAPSYSYNTDGQRLWVRDRYQATYQELRFASRTAERTDYVAGLNYFYERINESGHFWSTGPASVATPGVDPNYLNVLDLINNTTHVTYSAYAHANYRLNPKWRVTAGLRESSDKTVRRGTFASGPYAAMNINGPSPWRNPLGGVCTGSDDCVGVLNDGSGQSSKLTYNLGTDYQFTDSQMGYFTIATGYKAGGFNDFDPAINGPKEYGPENMRAYELGYKVHLPAGLNFNSSLYYYDYSQAQITQPLELNNDPNARILYTRLTPTTLYGWESSLAYAINQGNILNLSAAFERAHYDHFTTGASFNVDFSGKSLDLVPSMVLSAGWTHVWTVSTGSRLWLNVASRYSAPYYVTDFWSAQQYQQRAFTRSDADLTYASQGDRYSTQLYVRNMENKVQITGEAQGYVAGIPLSASGSVSEPRFWGVRQTVRF